MISFIIPTLNEEGTIEKTLKCISSYSGDKEIIVSDGGSRDNTAEIARKYANKTLVYHGSERQNIPKGRNTGAREAVGDFVVFIDADVTVPDMNVFMQKALSYFENDKKLIAITAECVVLKDMSTLMDKIVFKILALYFVFLNIIGFGAASGEFQMIKRDIFVQIKGYDERLPVVEDMELFWRLAKIGKTRLPLGFKIYHTGRRAHKIGWPKLIWQWISNTISVLLFRKADSEWKEIR